MKSDATKLKELQEEKEDVLAMLRAPGSDNDGGPSDLRDEVESLLSIQRQLVNDIVEMRQDRWISVDDQVPPDGEDFSSYERSQNVLVTDGHQIWVGYLTCEDSESDPQWAMIGRDSYSIEKVTHWASLPDLP